MYEYSEEWILCCEIWHMNRKFENRSQQFAEHLLLVRSHLHRSVLCRVCLYFFPAFRSFQAAYAAGFVLNPAKSKV